MKICMGNDVLKFENRREIFRNEINERLTNIFNKSYANLFELTVFGLDSRYNIEFVIVCQNNVMESILKTIEGNDVLGNTLLKEDVKTVGGYTKRIFFKIEANTKEELDSKLMYLNLMF